MVSESCRLDIIRVSASCKVLFCGIPAEMKALKNANKLENEMPEEKLVGLYFHSFSSGPGREIECQGVVKRFIGNGLYLVRLFSFIIGAPSLLKIRNISEMSECSFYITADEMSDAYDARHPE